MLNTDNLQSAAEDRRPNGRSGNGGGLGGMRYDLNRSDHVCQSSRDMHRSQDGAHIRNSSEFSCSRPSESIRSGGQPANAGGYDDSQGRRRSYHAPSPRGYGDSRADFDSDQGRRRSYHSPSEHGNDSGDDFDQGRRRSYQAPSEYGYNDSRAGFDFDRGRRRSYQAPSEYGYNDSRAGFDFDRGRRRSYQAPSERGYEESRAGFDFDQGRRRRYPAPSHEYFNPAARDYRTQAPQEPMAQANAKTTLTLNFF